MSSLTSLQPLLIRVYTHTYTRGWGTETERHRKRQTVRETHRKIQTCLARTFFCTSLVSYFDFEQRLSAFLGLQELLRSRIHPYEMSWYLFFFIPEYYSIHPNNSHFDFHLCVDGYLTWLHFVTLRNEATLNSHLLVFMSTCVLKSPWDHIVLLYVCT